ncbi:MAG: aldehyde reductase [Bacteroidota bacterium]
MDKNSDITVLVTGGTGFLGAHCVYQLLSQGYRVKTTLRSRSKEQGLVETLQTAGIGSLDHFQCIEADLTKDAHWEEALQECIYVLHVASPFPLKMPKDENELITPAVEGTLRVLRAARNSGVKRVVLTSSFAAIGYTHKDESIPITEEMWTDPSDKNISAYVKSKTLAERAAWDFMEKEGKEMELSVICPRFILGPSLGNRFTTSLTVIRQIFEGSMKATPNVSYGIIDVRDVADLHIRAMTHPNAVNQRFLATSGDPMTFNEIALFIKEKFGDKAQNVTTKVYPNWMVRMMAPFNPAARGIVPHLGKRLVTINDKATKMMDWEPRSKEEAILASVESILAERGN